MGWAMGVAVPMPELWGREVIPSGPCLLQQHAARLTVAWLPLGAGARPRWMQIRSKKPLQTALLRRALHPFCLMGGIFLFHFPYPWS